MSPLRSAGCPRDRSSHTVRLRMAAQQPRTMASCLPEHLIDGQSQCGEDVACSDGPPCEQHRNPAELYPHGMAFAQPAYGWHERFRGAQREVPGPCGTAFQMNQLARTFGSACTLDPRGASLLWRLGRDQHSTLNILSGLFRATHDSEDGGMRPPGSDEISCARSTLAHRSRKRKTCNATWMQTFDSVNPSCPARRRLSNACVQPVREGGRPAHTAERPALP